ncbi:MAG: hypothetical protein QMB92_05775, partial [Thiopseudomonas sp.]
AGMSGASLSSFAEACFGAAASAGGVSSPPCHPTSAKTTLHKYKKAPPTFRLRGFLHHLSHQELRMM